MPKMIDPSVKSQIIKMHLNGKGRNEIAESMKEYASSGTISNVIKQYREQPDLNKSNVRVTTFPEGFTDREFKKYKDISIKDHVTNTKDFEENGHPVDMGRKGGPLSFWFTNGYGFSSEGAVINKSSEVTKQQTKEDVQVEQVGNNSTDTSSISTASRYSGVGQPITNSSSTKSSKDSGIDTELVESNPPRKIYPREPKYIEDRFDVERRAWDYYGFAWTRILEQIKHEKYQRKHELFVIDRRKQKLEGWKAKLDEKTKQLDSREARILEVEPFLAVAKQLQNLGIGMDEALTYFESIRERAEIERIDVQTSATRIAQEYRQFGAIQGQIERANQELALINMATIKKQQAITVVEDLINNKGIMEPQIIQLIKFSWDRYWQVNGKNKQLGGINPGSNNGYDSISLNDMIRLKSQLASTTNMLNRMKTS